MSVIGSNILAGASGQGGYFLDNSLRFRSSESAYLSRTFTGTPTTWTFSAWVKRGDLASFQMIIASRGTQTSYLAFNTNSQLVSYLNDTLQFTTTAVFRDPSAWYHIVYKVTSSGASSCYVNGVSVASFTAIANSYIFNSAFTNVIGRYGNLASSYFDGYLTEVNFIDGQALDPTYFGETDAVTGVWKPKKYVGTYGTNGFYLPMKLDNTVEGFNTVTFIGNNTTNKIGGVGFSPDLVWFKNRSGANNHALYDSVRGRALSLISNATNSDITSSAGNDLVSFDTDGFTVGPIQNHTSVNGSGQSIVAWCWDAGNSTVSNSDGSITSSVRANPTYGFSVVSYTGNGSAGATVGHGLGVAPSIVICKNRNVLSHWDTYHASIGSAYRVQLSNTTAQEGPSTVYWNSTNPTTSVFSVGNGLHTNGSGNSIIAYCFAEVSGYSKFGSYTGTGAAGNTVTIGFRPAFVLIKRSDGVSDWRIWDTTRQTGVTVDKVLFPNLSTQELTSASTLLTVSDTGFTVANTTSDPNVSGATYIYMAFKDTREYAFWLDDSGNNNDWQPNGGITTQSSVTDVPTLTSETQGNYAVLNPIAALNGITTASLSNANLRHTGTSGVNRFSFGTFYVSSGKWYWEVTRTTAVTTYSYVGVRGSGSASYYAANGNIAKEGGTPTAYSSYGAGDIVGIAFDADNNTLEFFKNNVSQVELTGLTDELMTPFLYSGSTDVWDINFGQLPFAYTPPTGFKALNTYNLPDSTVADGSKHFDIVTRAGTGSTYSVSSLSFAPDLVWFKSRSTTYDNNLQDRLRGTNQTLASNNTDEEKTRADSVTSFDSNGYTGGSFVGLNASGQTYVDWMWKANGNGVSNTDGTITSTVSANTTAGFSIVTYTGNATAGATIGHGLGVAPSLIITKTRNTSLGNWGVYHASLGATKALNLNNTIAAFTSSLWWNNTAPTSSVFTVSTSNDVNGTSTYVAYCFAEVEGFSKMGSYTGNGSTDGPFVYTGFRPAWVMIKIAVGGTANWLVQDSTRDAYNPAIYLLTPNTSNAEASASAYAVDFAANGFKLRNSTVAWNYSGATFIYLAFAENPFKNSLGR